MEEVAEAAEAAVEGAIKVAGEEMVTEAVEMAANHTSLAEGEGVEEASLAEDLEVETGEEGLAVGVEADTLEASLAEDPEAAMAEESLGEETMEAVVLGASLAEEVVAAAVEVEMIWTPSGKTFQ